MNKKCPGCGYLLQSDKPTSKGYIPIDTKNKALYCERCFKIKHYNTSLVVEDKEIDEIINIVNKKGKLAFFLVDFLNISEYSMKTFNQLKIPKCLVISKSDIIPKGIKEESISFMVKKDYKVKDEIIFLSTLKNKNIHALPKIMNKHQVSEAYILGYTNAGKSSLISKLFENYQDKKALITVSNFPNTTLDFINIKLNESLKLIDSPGFVLKSKIHDDIALAKDINVIKFIKPITHQMKHNSSILINDLFRIENKNDIKNSFTFYISDKLNLEKVFESSKVLKSKAKQDLAIPEDTDIVIKGIGFINIKKSSLIRIYSDYLDLIEIRPSLFKD